MPRALDAKIKDTLKECGLGKEAVWDCHGSWVIYHWACEQIAAMKGIRFDAPVIVEAASKDKIAAICVVGRTEDRMEWSIGEAAPGNNKNAYPYAMAEKRAKDRVILKLVRLHGLVYSEEEADDFKDRPAGRDITYGVGSQAADPPALDIYTPWGETEEEHTDPKKYLNSLSEKMELVGAYFPSNEHTLVWVGKNITDKETVDLAKRVFRLGRDAWAQSPDNPINKEKQADG